MSDEYARNNLLASCSLILNWAIWRLLHAINSVESLDTHRYGSADCVIWTAGAPKSTSFCLLYTSEAGTHPDRNASANMARFFVVNSPCTDTVLQRKWKECSREKEIMSRNKRHIRSRASHFSLRLGRNFFR